MPQETDHFTFVRRARPQSGAGSTYPATSRSVDSPGFGSSRGGGTYNRIANSGLPAHAADARAGIPGLRGAVRSRLAGDRRARPLLFNMQLAIPVKWKLRANGRVSGDRPSAFVTGLDMLESLDIRTLLIVLAIVRILQAAGLTYIWRLHRQYLPARHWALGSLLVAVGVLLVASRSELSSSTPLYTIGEVLSANLFVIIGALLFNAGIVQAITTNAPWRTGAVAAGVALVGQVWFAIADPSSRRANIDFHRLRCRLQSLRCGNRLASPARTHARHTIADRRDSRS